MARRSQVKKAARYGSDSPSPSASAAGARPFALDFRSALIILGLVTLTIATLWPVFLCKFVNYDDPIWVTENRHIQQGLGIENIAWAFTQAYGYWTPIDILSHMLDCQLFGLNPAGHHATNLLIHVCNVVLLFLFLRGVTARPWCSALAAALFAIHPLNVEPVAWITGRKDVLSTFWAFLALLAYARYAARARHCERSEAIPRPLLQAATPHAGGGLLRSARNDGRDWRPYLLVAVLFMLSLMTKPAFLPFPVVLLFLDYWPLKRFEGLARNDFGPAQEGRKRVLGLVIEKVPLLCLAFAFFVLDYMTQRHIGAVVTKDAGLMFRAANAANSYLMYLWKAVWPSVLATPYLPRVPIPLWKAALTLATLAGITACAVACRKRCPYLFAGWFWYGLILFPVCGLLVTIGDFAMADRYAYVSMIGPFVAAAWGLDAVARRGRIARIAAAGLSAVVILAFAAVARFQVPYWHDGETLFNHAVAVGQASSVAFNNLGLLAKDQGRYDEAKAYLTKALDVNPRYVDVLSNLGLLAKEQGRYDEAKACLTKVLQLNPKHVVALNNLGLLYLERERYDEANACLTKALSLDPEYVEALNNMGWCLMNQGRYDEAKPYLAKALDLNPKHIEALNNMGWCLINQARYDDAKPYLGKALDLNPKHVNALNNMGWCLINQARYDDAKPYLGKALDLNPKHVNALNNMGWCLMNQGQLEEAERHFREALKIDPQFIRAMKNLGAVLAKLGRQEEANGYFNRARELAPAAGLNQAVSGK